MPKRIVAVSALAILFAIVPASAEECVPDTWFVEVDGAPLAPVIGRHFYVDIDNVCQLDDICPMPWIYEETNGVTGLQREDAFARDRSCGNPDTLIF